MTCTKRTSRIIMAAALLAALIAATAPAASAAARSTDHPATAAHDGGWRAILGPWHAIETWLRNVTGADSGEGSKSEGETGSASAQEEPPTCGPGQNPGPCTDPGG